MDHFPAAAGKTLINVDGSASFASTKAKIGNDGHFESDYVNIHPSDLRTSKATTGDLTTAVTGKYLTTQNYVDGGLWYIQKTD